jgi:zinc protease
MNRFFASGFLVSLIASFVATTPFAAGAPFPHESSDLKPDAAVHWGKLVNGLRYAVMHNAEPKGRVSIRLAVTVGSLNEREDERGLAHFIEHEAFNGSEHFAPGTLVEYFQRLGMSFGGDTNAYTAFDRTVYQLDLPDAAPGTLTNALTLISDFARGVQFTPRVIDKERGIIESERRARDSVDSRASDEQMKFLLPGSLLAERMPIGLSPVIQAVKEPLFESFYNGWYRPDAMIVAVVGDVDPKLAEQLIQKTLGKMKPKGPARPALKLDEVPSHATVTVRLHTDAEAPVIGVSLIGIGPYRDEPDTTANRLRQLPRDVAVMMLNRRLAILAKKENSPISRGTLSYAEQFHFYRQLSLHVNSEPGRWKDALALAEQELRGALEQGFQADELRDAVAIVRNKIEQAVQTVSTRRSRALADDLIGTVIANNVFTDPATDKADLMPALDRINAEDCARALRETWALTPDRSVYVSGNLMLTDPDKEIIAAYEASRAMPVVARVAPAAATFAYTDFGPQGKLVTRQHVEDLDVTLAEFSNGVRLNLKRTAFQADSVQVGVRIAGGSQTQPKTQPGLASLVSGTFLAGGLGRHDTDDLHRIIAGHTVGLNFGVGDDVFSLNGTTNAADLLFELQLLAAFVTDPGYRPEALRQFHQQMEQTYASIARSVEGPMQAEVPTLLASGDSRFGMPASSVMNERTLAEAKAWLKPQLATGAMEIAIVGDVDVDQAIAAVARTFGALPVRVKRSAFVEDHPVVFPAQVLNKTFAVPTDTPRGKVVLDWPATDGRDLPRARRLSLLASILQDRLRVTLREKMGDTYSPNAAVVLSQAFPGYGYLSANATVAPGSARIVADAIRDVAADLVAHGVADDELKRAKEPILTQIRQDVRDNAYWGRVLANAQEEPRQLDWCRARLADFESITKLELDALAAKYLAPGHAFEFISVPEKT